MRISRTFCMLAAAAVSIPGTASAADLTAAELTSMFFGKTAYLEFAQDNQATKGGQGVMFYHPDGKVSARMPSGLLRKGQRTIKDNTACMAWEGAAPSPCARLEKDGDKLKVIGVDGKPLATIIKIVDGNPEKL